MRKLKQERIFPAQSHWAVFFFIFFGYFCLFFPPLAEADTGKKIKAHPNVRKESSRSAEDLKAQAQAYNGQAITLFEEGRYAEAQGLWEKAIDLMEHPRAGDIDFEAVSAEEPFAEVPELPVASDESLEISPIAEQYQAGLSLLEQKEYGEARKIFQEIDAAQPDYRNTKRYLIVIDELLREEDSAMEQEPMGDEARGQLAVDQQEYPEVVPEPQGVDVEHEFDQRQEEARWEEAVEQAEQKLQDQIAERAEPIYQTAVQHYKRKEYVEARNSFEQVQVLSPDYKLTAKYLDGIDDDILYAQQQKEEERQLAEDRARRQDELGFRRIVAAKEDAYHKELLGKAEEIYQQAIKDFKNRKFAEAADGFGKVDASAPDYKLTGKYLGYIRKARDNETRRQAEEEARRQALAQHDAEEDLKRTVAESERMRRQGLREKAEAVYQKAMTDYGQGETAKARAGFSEVEEILPDYRFARKYLVLIDEDTAREQKLKLEAARQPEALVDLTTTAEIAVVPTPRERLEAQELYRQAKESYKKREFAKAKELFEKVNAAVRGYQATENFLARIDSDIHQEDRYQQDLRRREAQRQERKEAVEQKRAAAEAAAARRRPETRGWKEAAARIKSDRDQTIARKARKLYREAESDYARGLYALAKERFTEVQRIVPGYRSTEKYLGNIARAYGREAAVATPAIPLRAEEKVSQVPVPVAREEIIIPVEKIAAPKVAEPEIEQQRQLEEQQQALARAMRAEKKKTRRAQQKQEREAASRAAKEKATEKITKKNQFNVQKAEETKRARLLARAEKKYAQALAAYAKKDFISAKQKFAELEKFSANFKETARYLSRIDADIAAQNQKPAEAVAAPVYVQPPSIAVKGPARAKADALFRAAARLYAAKQFVPAREKFQEVEQLVPGHKTTGKYITLIDRAIARRQKKESRAKQIQDARAARLEAAEQGGRERAEKARQENERKQQAQAKRAPRRVPAARSVRVDPPDFSAFELTDDVGALRRQYARIQEERKGVQGAIQVRVEQTYAQAVRLYDRGYYAGAKNLFQEIAAAQPSFKGTKNYLTRIDQRLAKLPASAIMPGKGIEAPSVYVAPRARVVTDALDSLEAPRQ